MLLFLLKIQLEPLELGVLLHCHRHRHCYHHHHPYHHRHHHHHLCPYHLYHYLK
jgi:hypothetical protein